MLLALLIEVMRRVVERHGGTVEKFIGDAVMAVFGFPSSTRTTRCVLSERSRSCVSCCTELNEELRAAYGMRAPVFAYRGQHGRGRRQ